MPSFPTNIGAVLAAHALNWGIGLLLLLAAGGSGFVWGETRATRLALQTVSADADARIAAAQKASQSALDNYLAKLTAQKTQADALNTALTAAETKLAAQAKADQEAIAHAVPNNSACELSAAALGLLGDQPARH